MGVTINRVLVVANRSRRATVPILQEIDAYFEKKGITLVHHFSDRVPTRLKDVNLVISLGGDGTLLLCARAVAERGIPILAVNTGTFGFITEISSHEWMQAYERYVEGELGLSPRIMIRADVVRNGDVVDSRNGLNDAVITSRGVSRLIGLRLYLSGSYAGRYRADGVIIATPTGSTAYSMGAGGPILHPEMEAFILNPICPFTLSNRPLVVPADETVEMEVEETRRAEVLLAVDGSTPIPLEAGDRVVYGKLPVKSLIIRSDKRNFYEVLRSKLNWSGEPNLRDA